MARKMDDIDERLALLRTLRRAIMLLKQGMDEGPDGPNTELTPAECTVLYKTLEKLGIRP